MVKYTKKEAEKGGLTAELSNTSLSAPEQGKLELAAENGHAGN